MIALALVACRPPPAAAPTPREAPPPRLAIAPPREPEPPLAVGSLERPAALARFFAALARLESGAATDDVRVVQLGDSHTAADWQTGPMRRQLQARFGDGGRGFVPIGLPWKAWSQEGVLEGTAGAWSTQMTALHSRQPGGDGVFGLSGFALASRQGGSRAWIDVLATTSRAELYYLEQPGGGSFDLVVDGVRSRVATRAEARRSAFHAVELSAATRHRIEARALGDGEVRLFGLALDRAEQHGLVLDALGINGARVATALSWNEAHFTEQLRHRAPELVILAYGTNDAIDVETSLDAFEADAAAAALRIARAAPSSSCLLLGPPDRANKSGDGWRTPARLVEIVARERKVAHAAGCAFYDQLAAMGGEGAMARWATEAYPRGQPDRVHLSRQGYADLATAFVTDLQRAYDQWRSATQELRDLRLSER
ncbi:MAG: hypothetical protein KIT84_29640 [Labilithrix sp.]|nr:hypothetical protein [Labilithrix sp.]MCW5815226.1 hypothetical protein [Labilithrix sp.]